MSDFNGGLSDQSTPTGGDTSVTPAPAIPGAIAQPATPGQAPTGATPSPAIPEGYVPSYRLREAREAAVRQANAEFAQREAGIRAEAERYKQQLHQLVGATPPGDPQVDEVRKQFATLYPGLAKMEEKAQQLQELLERQGDSEAQVGHYWQTYGRQTMDRLFTHASEAMGGAPLPEGAKRMLHNAFTGFVQSSPELTARYAEDPTLVDDFWREFSSGFIDPARRASNAQVAGRVTPPLPQDSPGGQVRTTPVPAGQNLDDRAQTGWARFNQFKTNGQ